MRDFEAELTNEHFWDLEAERLFKENGAPLIDQALQTRAEVVELCRFIEEHKVSSYLEIGAWTGRLVSILHRLFNFKMVAACDLGLAKSFGFEVNLPGAVQFFEGNSLSPIYPNWRSKLGLVDFVFIDTTHSYEDVKKDFEVNRRFPHRFIAFSGIAGSDHTGDGVKRFWDELKGKKTEIILPTIEAETEQALMGIGIWSKPIESDEVTS